MRKIITTTFMTLDGVMQAPGGPEEDTTGKFAHGGWTVNFWDDPMSEVMDGFMHLPFDLLLGKRTYDIFASYWPTAKTDQLVADKFNSTRKYVVSHTPMPLPWQNSFLVSGDVPAELKKLKKTTAPTCGCTAAATSSRPCSRTGWSTACTCGPSPSPSAAASACSPRAPGRTAGSWWTAGSRPKA